VRWGYIAAISYYKGILSMAKKPSHRYLVVLILCVVLIAGVGALGLMDMRGAATDASVPVVAGVL
jgi:hypothetical protein